MPILCLDLKQVTGDYVELRYFKDEPSNYDSSSPFPKREIAKLNHIAERDYYVDDSEVVDYSKTGQDLYEWLDGSDRILQKLLDSCELGEVVVLAIATAENLAHLPWELLHDGRKFLVERDVVPVRWVSSKKSNKLTIEAETEKNRELKNRALRVLFMASSPIDVEPVLDYEDEERGILEATEKGRQQRSLELVVEESGSLEGLRDSFNHKDSGYFDVLHLMGHTTVRDRKTYFIAEKTTGEADYASARDIVKQMKFSRTKLIFLSACNTAKATQLGTVPSISESLLESGAKAVLGWGKSVSDKNAILAAKVLYEELSVGKQVTEAVAITYQKLIEKQAQDWHLLRLYTAGTLPGKLVLNTNGRKLAPPASVATEFLDPEGRVKVATRESFVGRRRQLQNCLRTFYDSTDKLGVLIHGMGGLGKSSIAARLCDRLPNYKRVVWVRRVDENNLAKILADKLDEQEQRNELQNSGEGLKYRLKRVFNRLGEKNFLLVLDDFEHNFDPRHDKYALTSEAVTVLKAIVEAIQQSDYPHRIIITCRYDFDFTDSKFFYKQPLDALRGADLQKKWNRLTDSDNKDNKSQIDETLQSQVKKLADGNPRLLEELYKESQKPNIDKTSLKNKLLELLPEVFTEKLCNQIIDQPMRDMLQQGLVFELPVPKEALEAVCKTIPNLDLDQLDKYIDKAVKLGFLEVSFDQSLRVPRNLPLKKLDEISLNKEATKVLNRLWYEQAETKIEILEERLLEIHRLAKLANETEIIVKMTEILATRWKNRSRPREVVELCTETLKHLKDNVYDVAQVVIIMDFLADSNLLLGYYEKAKSQYNEALNIREKHLESEEEYFDLAKTLNGLGYLYSLIGEKEYDKSKDMLDKALNIINKKTQEKLFNKVQDWYWEEKLFIKVQCLSHLAYWHRVQEEWEKARFLYIKALWMCKRLSTEKNITLAESYHNLATVYYEQDAYKKAEAWYSRALNLSQKLLGEEHLTIATISTSLAKVYLLQKCYKYAEILFDKALKIRSKILKDHIQVVQVMKNLGDTNYDLKEYKKSKYWYNEALKMIEMLINQKDPSVNNNQDILVQELKNFLDKLADV